MYYKLVIKGLGVSRAERLASRYSFGARGHRFGSQDAQKQFWGFSLKVFDTFNTNDSDVDTHTKKRNTFKWEVFFSNKNEYPSK